MTDNFVSSILSLSVWLFSSLVFKSLFFSATQRNSLFNLSYLHYSTVRVNELWMSQQQKKKTHENWSLLFIEWNNHQFQQKVEFVFPYHSFVLFWVAFKYIMSVKVLTDIIYYINLHGLHRISSLSLPLLTIVSVSLLCCININFNAFWDENGQGGTQWNRYWTLGASGI